MAGCSSGRQLQPIADPQNGSLWSQTESQVLVSAILAATASSSCTDQKDGAHESWNFDWNVIHSLCQKQGIHKEIRELKEQWIKLQEDYAKLAIVDHHRCTAGTANVVQQIDPRSDAVTENVDVEIEDAIDQSIGLCTTGNQSTPSPAHPSSSTASCKHLIQPCDCTEASEPPAASPALSPAPSPSPAPTEGNGESESQEKPPPFKPGPISGPH